jgi:hypothetical protein
MSKEKLYACSKKDLAAVVQDSMACSIHLLSLNRPKQTEPATVSVLVFLWDSCLPHFIVTSVLFVRLKTVKNEPCTFNQRSYIPDP